MATRDNGAGRLVQVTAHEAMSIGLAELAIGAALELLHGGGYAKPSGEQFAEMSKAITRAALAMPHLVDDMAATSDEQLEDAARTLGALVVREVLGPPAAARMN